MCREISFIKVPAIHFAGEKQKPLEKDAGQRTIAWLDKLRNSNGSLPTSQIRLNMQRVMQNNAAVFRTQETLEEGSTLLINSAWSSYPYYPFPMVHLYCSFNLSSLNFIFPVAGCQLIDKAWESFHDVKLKDRSLIW